jgi:hypothetical protein
MIRLDLGFSICGEGIDSIEVVFPTYSNVSGIEVNEIMLETNIDDTGTRTQGFIDFLLIYQFIDLGIKW